MTLPVNRITGCCRSVQFEGRFNWFVGLIESVRRGKVIFGNWNTSKSFVITAMNVFYGRDLGFCTITVGAADAATSLYENEPTRNESERQLISSAGVGNRAEGRSAAVWVLILLQAQTAKWNSLSGKNIQLDKDYSRRFVHLGYNMFLLVNLGFHSAALKAEGTTKCLLYRHRYSSKSKQ